MNFHREMALTQRKPGIDMSIKKKTKKRRKKLTSLIAKHADLVKRLRRAITEKPDEDITTNKIFVEYETVRFELFRLRSNPMSWADLNHPGWGEMFPGE